MKRRDFLKVSLASAGVTLGARAWGLPRQLGGNETLGDGNDGEGTARILSPGHVVAGEPTSVVIAFTAGDSGIPVGGGVVVALHHAAWWSPAFQIDNPGKPGYVTTETPPGVVLDTRHEGWIPKEMLADPGQALWSDGIFHVAFIFKVTGSPLNPGDTIVFHMGQPDAGGAVHAIADTNHQFRVMTDADGNGVYKGIAESPMLDIVAGPPHHLAAFCPAQIKTGEPFELQVQAEDISFNCVRDPQGRASYNGTISVHDEDGSLLAEAVRVENGIGRITLTVGTPGPRRFRVSDGSLEGRANPCKAFDELPEHRVYWGDIHGHTGVSDGLGDDCDEYYSYGRDIACLDVCALTDHGHFDWPQTIDAAKKFHEPGRYVTLLAQEAGAGSDHVNYYFLHDDTPHVRQWVQDYKDLQDLVLEQYNTGASPEAAIGPHHFTYKRGDDRYPFGVWDTRVCRFVEVYSSHGTNEYPGNPRPVGGPQADSAKFMQEGLARGLRFGVIASSDNHDSRPGRTVWGHYPGGLVAFLAPELTREAVWKSLWDRHTYATSMDRIYLEFTVNGQIMGSEIETGGPVEIAFEAVGQTDGVKAELICNNEVIRTEESGSGMLGASLTHQPPAPDSFYYLRVTQDNGERAWSSPIWVTIRMVGAT
jgi:hypothetical protein